LRVNAPAGPLSNDAVRGVVHDACVRAGVAPVGAHRLRHYVDGWVMWPAGVFPLLGLAAGPIPAT
jgi:hypothetical protein